ncbi:MAG TPA: chromosome segregation protein SMC [Candidatus Acidoferrales bacterium]|nr:chromosome segregation protein SMC [Candidatus Acidoferrales bacterium]
MLKLKRVELQGFKSFCDRTELRFNGEGIAAIVGPNGCGKSNISDAISWVLGEQSAKSLRGSRMEDVIFAGTRDRKPLGMAYVTMTLVDPDVHDLHAGVAGPVPVPDGHPPKRGEITITRRLFRSGESEYLIDGRAARLRDIQDIFMGTGLGPESYAIIEQGRIGQILSSKPQDRRNVIEEAAGITRFKTRKRLAEAKLEGAKQNLARVYDILEEVTRQVNSLKRQASKAKRYTELKTELETRLRVVLSGKYRLLERDAAETAIQLSLANTSLRELGDQVTEKELAHERQQSVCYEGEQQLTAARQQLSGLQLEAERTRGRLESQVKESGAIEQRIAHSEKESQELEARLNALDEEIGSHQTTVEALEAQIAQARGRMMETNQQREQLQIKVRERERAIEQARQVILRLLGEASTLKNQLAQIDEYLAGIDRETARSTREEQVSAAEIDRLDQARKQLSETVAERQLELEAVTGERRRTEEELAERRRTSVELRREIDGLKTEVSQIRARKESLEQVLAHRTYTTESVKRLFASLEKGKAGDLKPMGVMADYVEVDPQFEKPTEEFLHEELEYVVVENWQQAERGLDFIRAELEGRATFLVHPEAGTNGRAHLPEPAIGPETGIAARLSESLRLTNGFRDRAVDLLPRVSLCFLAEDRAAAQRLAVSYPHLYFLLPDGVCYHGHTVTGGKKSGAGPLAMKREARELTVKLQGRQARLDEMLARLDSLNQEIIGLEAELERLRAAQQAREKDRVALDHDMRKLGEDISRANSRLSVARLELERLRRDAGKSAEQRERSRAAVSEKERLRAQSEEALEAERQELEKLEGQAATIAEEHAASRADLAGLEERNRGERSAMGRLQQQWDETTKRHGAIAPEIARLGEQRARLLADNIELDRKAALLAEQINSLEARVNEMASEEAGMRENLRAGEEELKFLRAAVQECHEKRTQVEIDLVRKQAELKFLDETSRKELNCPVVDLASADDPVPDSDAITEAEQSANEVRHRIEGLGAVNAAAMEEYQEAQQRQDFLSAQRQDLIDSIRDTEKAIQEIDQVSRQKFAEAFEAINANFRVGFQTLFGGGTGEMRLTDQANMADSGIDIVCSPPGKRLQNVLLLSGGEKALAAVALLMAIFKYQPSPFCIMDEVDAPLDEANIGRLTKLVREMSAETQFVVITHSKRTMEAAQALYGVTMQEPGVSRLVSVKFNANEAAA